MLVKIEQNRMVQTTRKFELIDKKLFFTIFDCLKSLHNTVKHMNLPTVV